MTGSSPNGANGHVDPGVSIRFGPVEGKDVKMGDSGEDLLYAGKRKSRASIGQKKSYAEAESSEEDEPLVRPPPFRDDICSHWCVRCPRSEHLTI